MKVKCINGGYVSMIEFRELKVGMHVEIHDVHYTITKAPRKLDSGIYAIDTIPYNKSHENAGFASL